MKFNLVAICVLLGSVSLNVNALPYRDIQEEDPPTCPPLGDFYAPHEDCTKYYICNNGNLLIANCPGELLWNQDILACDFYYNVPECKGGTRPPSDETAAPPTLPPPTTQAPTTPEPETEAPTTEEPETEPPTTEEPETEAPTTQEPETDAPTTEPEEPTTRDPNNPCVEDGVYALPIENDCQAYIQCFNGLAIPMTCAEGLQFDPEIGKCNKEELVNCTVTTTEPTVATTIVTTPKPFCEEPGAYLVPFDDEWCSPWYVICNDHVPSLQECAEGLYFDPVTLKCERTEVANCEEKPTTTTPAPPETTTGAPIYECTEDGVYTIPVPGSNCLEYILCINYQPLHQTCADGTLFNEAEGKCVRAEDYECPVEGSEPPKSTTEDSNPVTTSAPVEPTGVPETGPTTENLYPCPPTGFWYLPHHAECAKFYMCSDGEFRGVYTCGSNYWFDSEIQGCVPPEDSDCTLEPKP